MDIETYFNAYTDKLSQTLQALDRKKLQKLVKWMSTAYRNEKTIFVFGNGGSGANASHIAGDFIKGASFGLKKRFRFVCLNDNVAALMAIANDVSYDDIFVEQLKNFVQPDDIVIGLSGSGNSINVLKALEYAKQVKAKTVAFCGYSGGKMKAIAALAIHADINDMEICEDIQLVIAHCIKQTLIAALHDKDSMGDKYDQRILGAEEA